MASKLLAELKRWRGILSRHLRTTLSLLWLFGLTACDTDLWGESETAIFRLSGVVTSAVDGDPINGAKIYLAHSGYVFTSKGVIESDTAVANAEGHYHLEAGHYCPTWEVGSKGV